MEISCVDNGFSKNNSMKKCTFGSVRLHPITLETSAGKKSAYFTKLDKITDIDAVKFIEDKWQKDYTGIKRGIVNLFKDKEAPHEFYGIELEGSKPLGQRLLSVSAVLKHFEDKKTKVYLNYLLTKPEFQQELDVCENRRIKNVGRLTFEGIINEAQKFGAKVFHFDSICDIFYKKISDEAGGKLYKNDLETVIESCDFAKFKENSKKYGAEFDKNA